MSRESYIVPWIPDENNNSVVLSVEVGNASPEDSARTSTVFPSTYDIRLTIYDSRIACPHREKEARLGKSWQTW